MCQLFWTMKVFDILAMLIQNENLKSVSWEMLIACTMAIQRYVTQPVVRGFSQSLYDGRLYTNELTLNIHRKNLSRMCANVFCFYLGIKFVSSA